MIKRILITIMVLAFALLGKEANATLTWTITTIDSNAGRGAGTAIALDINSVAYVAYYDQNNGDLRYATNSAGGIAGSTWTLSAVDTVGNVGLYPQIGVDNAKNPYIGYWDKTNGRVKFASLSSGTWALQSVDNVGASGEYMGMSFSTTTNASYNVIWTYYERNLDRLRYQIMTSGALMGAQNIDTTNTPAGIQSAPVMQYQKALSGGTTYLIWRKGYTVGKLYFSMVTVGQTSFTPTIIDQSGNTGLYPAITMSGITVHATYFSKGSKTLMYATMTVGGAWATSTVVSNIGLNGGYCSIGIKSGAPVIAYYDSNSSAIRYVSTSGSWGAYTWTSENVYNGTSATGKYISMAVNVGNGIQLCFYDQTNRILLYATGN